jgi:general secretion pathway protein G
LVISITPWSGTMHSRDTASSIRIRSGRSHAAQDRASTGSRGYTLIELLVVVVIIGLLAAIGIPNLLNALERSRQKRTMADMRAICEAIEMYHHDQSQFPRYEDVTAESLARALKLYVQRYNHKDGWNRPFWYDSDGDHYTLVSYGSDGVADPVLEPGPSERFSDDIVFSDGAFVRWPEGRQR